MSNYKGGMVTIKIKFITQSWKILKVNPAHQGVGCIAWTVGACLKPDSVHQAWAFWCIDYLITKAALLQERVKLWRGEGKVSLRNRMWEQCSHDLFSPASQSFAFFFVPLSLAQSSLKTSSILSRETGR